MPLVGTPKGGKITLQGSVSETVDHNNIRFVYNSSATPGTSGAPVVAVRKGTDGGIYELVGVHTRAWNNVPFGDGVMINRVLEKFERNLKK